MIISVSRRTDIPAYYSEWFFNRIKAGFCKVPNPFNPRQISTVSLLPDDVTAFAFWTRNPAPMLKYLSILDEQGYKYYFMVTLNNYPSEIEPTYAKTDDAIRNFNLLSEKIGKSKVVWRYDPILLTDKIDSEFHIENFKYLFGFLKEHTNKVITSIITPYRKTKRNLAKAGIELVEDKTQYTSIIDNINKIAGEHNIKATICCPPEWIDTSFISTDRCIDNQLLNKEFGLNLPDNKDRSQRKNCNCFPSKDIGINNTCLAGCRYCYATQSYKTAIINQKKHNKDSEYLI